MPKTSISSLELSALISELQFLVHGKISQVYHPEEKELILQVHVPNQGKQLLKIISGKWLCLTKKPADNPTKPSGFCMQMRKHLDNIIIKKIQQKDTERIVILELEREEKYYFLIELFSKGNIILADKDYKIIGLLEKQSWQSRELRVGEKYQFPPSSLNWKELSAEEMLKVFHKSQKKNLATSLATEIGLGGVYAEELSKMAGIDKNKLPQEITPTENKKLFSALKHFIKQIQEPRGHIYTEQIAPLALSDQTPLKETPTYNEAIDSLNVYQKKSPYEKKIKSLLAMIESQQEAIKTQEFNIAENTQKGQLIYENYQKLLPLLEFVKEQRKSKDWKDVEIELKKLKKIKKVDLKNKKVVVEL